jgi:8-oxo-dGTP pyrophosphatase MutT (NUDIX family)
MFRGLFGKKKIKKAVTAFIETRDGLYLLGKRKDTNKWSFVGGGVDKYEAPKKAMEREALEEIGLNIQNFNYVKKVEVEPYKKAKYSKIIVYIFHAKLDENSKELIDKLSLNFDPDQEFKEFKLFSAKELVSGKVDLHIPADKNELIKMLKEDIKGDNVNMDAVSKDNLLDLILNETSAIKKAKLIQSFNKLGAVAKLKVIREYNELKENATNSNNDLVKEALEILNKNKDITLEDLEWFTDERIAKLEALGQEKKVIEDKLDKLLRLFEILNDDIQYDDVELDSAKTHTLQKAFEDLFLDKGADNSHLANRRAKALDKIRAMIKNDVEVREIFEELLEDIGNTELDNAILQDDKTKSLFD